MERSMFGSAIKTYPSKTKRISRSYRPSSTTALSKFAFVDNIVDPFDLLVEEEKLKNTIAKENIDNTKFNEAIHRNASNILSSNGYKRATLKSIQNVDSGFSIRNQSARSNDRFINPKYHTKDKENLHKFSSCLFVSDSDSSADQLENQSLYNHLPDLEESKGNTVKRKKQKKKCHKSTKSNLHSTRKSTARKKLLNRYRMKCYMKTTNGKKLLKAVSTPVRPFYTNEVWDLSAIKNPILTSEKYNANIEEKYMFSYKNQTDTDLDQNVTPIFKKQFSANSMEEKIKIGDELCKLDFPEDDQNSTVNEWLNSFVNNNQSNNCVKKINYSNLENYESNLFNPVGMSTPELDRKFKVQSIPPTFGEKYAGSEICDKNCVKNWYECSNSKNNDTENLCKWSANEFDENHVKELEAEPNLASLSREAVEELNVLIQSDVMKHISMKSHVHDSCKIILNNEKNKIISPKCIDSNKESKVSRNEFQLSSPPFANEKSMNELIYSTSKIPPNNSSFAMSNIKEVSHLSDTNTTLPLVSAVSLTDNCCLKQIDKSVNLFPETIVDELISTSTLNSEFKNLSNGEKGLISCFKNLGLNSENYASIQNTTVSSPCKKLLDIEDLKENFKITLSLSGNKPTDQNFVKKKICMNQNFNLASPSSETKYSLLNDMSLISKAEQLRMENKISKNLENSISRLEMPDVTNTSSLLSDSDEKCMTIIEISEVVPHDNSGLSYSSVSSGEFFGFEFKSKKPENTVGSYGSIISELENVISKKDTSSFNYKSPKCFDLSKTSYSSEKLPDVSNASLNVSNVTYLSTDSSEFIGFSYDLNSDNKNSKLNALTEIACLTNNSHKKEISRLDLCSEDLLQQSLFNNSFNSNNNSLSDTVVCKIIENKTKELENFNFNRTNKINLSVSPLNDCKNVKNMHQSPLMKDNTSEIFPFVQRDNCQKYQKNVASSRLSTVKSLLKENEEETSVDSAKLMDMPDKENICKITHQNFFTERRKRRCALPTLKEGEIENDYEVSYKQNSFFDNTSILTTNKSTFPQSLFLTKGKKWRRSFITLKNIRDFGFNKELHDENKGRCWKRNIENLISIQSDATITSHGRYYKKHWKFLWNRIDNQAD